MSGLFRALKEGLKGESDKHEIILLFCYNFHWNRYWYYWLKKSFEWSVSLCYFYYGTYFIMLKILSVWEYILQTPYVLGLATASKVPPNLAPIYLSHSALSTLLLLLFLEHASLNILYRLFVLPGILFSQIEKMLSHSPDSSLAQMSPSQWTVPRAFYLHCRQLPNPTLFFHSWSRLPSSMTLPAHTLTYDIL